MAGKTPPDSTPEPQDEPVVTPTGETVIDAEFEPVDEPAPDVKSPPPPRNRPAWPLVWALFLIALIGGATMGALLPRFVPALAPPPTAADAQIAKLQQQVQSLGGQLANLPAPDTEALSQRISDLEDRVSHSDAGRTQAEITGLEQRVEALEETPASNGTASGADLKPILQQLKTLESAQPDMSLYVQKSELPAPVDLGPLSARVAALETQESRIDAEAGALPEDLQSIKARLSALETREADDSGSQAQATWSQLQLAAQGTDPFPDSLQAALAMWPHNDGLRSLAPIAAEGAPTIAQLRSRFDAMIPALMAKEHAVPDNANWMQKAGAAIGALVSVRDTSGKGDSVDARITRAQKALHINDLPAAMVEIRSLPDKYGDLTQEWLAQARARDQLQNILSAAAPKPEAAPVSTETNPAEAQP